jgi:hypothetical protein
MLPSVGCRGVPCPLLLFGSTKNVPNPPGSVGGEYLPDSGLVG